MSFTSIEFIAFFILTILVYYILPHKVKNIWLLLTSLFFYAYASIKAFFVLIFIIIASYILARIISVIKKKRNRILLLVVSAVVIIGCLILFKYIGFFTICVNKLLLLIGTTKQFTGVEIIVPLGISFFTLQSLGYIIDVYRGDIKAEKNIIDYALFLSFFPYVTMGPIERAKNILPRLKKRYKFDYTKFCHGLQMMLWGFFMKIVIAERLCVMANSVFDDYMYFTGFDIAIGILAYTFQIYFDFAGYSYIARGMAAALGIDVMENFKQPYFARTVSEFWRRWHIGLSSWLKDYLYIPLGGNRKGKVRKYINIMIVFLVSGLWHGAAVKYIVWGGLHGLYQVFGAVTKPVRNKMISLVKAKRECFSYKLLQVMVTFIPVSIAWVLFRAPSMSQAWLMVTRMVKTFSITDIFSTTKLEDYYWWVRTGKMLNTSGNCGIMNMGLEVSGLLVLLASLILAFVVDILCYKKISCTKLIDRQNIWFRWIVYIGLLMAVLILGMYGSYDASSFIYGNF